MSAAENEVVQPIVSAVLFRRAGQNRLDASTIAQAANRAAADLASVVVPLIGQVGVDALMNRALHLAERKHPAQRLGPVSQGEGAFADALVWMERQNDAPAREAAITILSTF